MGNVGRRVFLTGATGYIGSALARELVGRGHRVRALVRAGSESKVPDGCKLVRGDAQNRRPLIIADGYHRICAAYYFDENRFVDCRMANDPDL